ncbi:anaphase-promoting complex subunit CDC26-like [Anneissia japonica]|uniref:anaphase-promoting complex subunit CDC26-like n=1 Tax=Anneissia japonica TaxID=1529436 RepID=UPI001425B0AB|nr:anaphase-promoting complex subunit CDC26-like [Anneissia japonica]
MIKRGPTRIEPRLEDIDEFERLKKELENKRREKNQTPQPSNTDQSTSSPAQDTAMEGLPLGLAVDAKQKQEEIHRRIGYDPTPVQTASNRIGELRDGV